MILALLLAAMPLGTGCVTEVDVGDEEGSDQAALDGEEGDECEVGESRECVVDAEQGLLGFQACELVDFVPTWSDCQQSATSTPLVLAFEGQRVDYVTSMEGAGAFDLSGLGATIATDWPTAATPWLALDRDGDGAISGGEELFGSATALSSGARAQNGFAALAELDADGDGWITPADPAFSRLLLWSDADADRVSDAGELSPLASRGVTGVAARHERAPRCDARGNCEIERAAFTFEEGGVARTGAVVDVHLRWQ